jgi:hypothetical protein
MFALLSSISSPRAASVEGLKSNRAASFDAEVSTPAELKNVAVLARVKVIAGFNTPVKKSKYSVGEPAPPDCVTP